MDNILASTLSVSASWLNAIVGDWQMPRFWPLLLFIPALLFWLDYKHTKKNKAKGKNPGHTA